MNNYSKYGVSESFWNKLSEDDKFLFRKINPFFKEEDKIYNVKANDLVNEFKRLENEAISNGGSFKLIPDYQRDNNKWNKKQKIAFVENLIRNIAPVEFKFNLNKKEEFSCIDGIQRLTAIQDFINGEFFVFEDMTLEDLSKTRFSLARRNLIFKLYNFENNIDLYNFYLKLNEGGTPHSEEDLKKVKELIKIEENK